MANEPLQPVEEWLIEQGFTQYIPLFAENAIDFELLPTLSENDLRSLGLPFGHARRLAIAAAKLSQVAIEPATANELPLASEPERRQLTVMFCDLVGSTTLSSRLDPEDLRDILQRYQKTCAEVISRHGGFIAQYMGDGIMVFFGYPQAQEDAAERAVRAGLEIITAVNNLKTAANIQVRIGAATGLAVVGDLIGRGSSEQTAVIGQTPNLAARVQTLADPGCMTIAESTHRLVGDLFIYRDLGLQRMKGIDDDIRVLQVIGERLTAARFESMRTRRISCVGRQRELDFLLEKWRQVVAGRGQAVFAWGEAGIGKSRLLRLLSEKLDNEPMLRVQAQCSPQHGATPLYPVINANLRAMNFSPEDSIDDKLDKIERFLELGQMVDRAPLLAAMMSVPTASRYPPLQLSAEQIKNQTLQLCVDFIINLASRQPVLYQVEDAHWIDPTTEELLARLADRIVDQRVLLLVTGRPECRPSWLGQPHASSLDLGRLGELEIRLMVQSVAAGKELPEEVMTQILAKTDGVPLYVEELTRNILESGLLRETSQSWELSGPLPPMAIPSTLQDSLMARLDRLASAKELIQVAALIGRRFSFSMLSAVLDYPESLLRAALERLLKVELLFRRGNPPNDEYEFRHALIQDAACDSLLKSRRIMLHARIVRALETHFPMIVDTQPELLAHHAEQADQIEKAIGYGLQAGRRTIARSANREAIKLLSHAIDLVPSIPEKNARIATELDLQLALGQACMALYGYAAPQTVQPFERAQILSERTDQPHQYFAVIYGLWANNAISGRLRTASDLAIAFLGRACQDNEHGYQCIGHRMVGNTAFYRGYLFDACEHLYRAMELYDAERHSELALQFGTDISVAALVYLCWAEGVMGHPDTAAQHVKTAIERAGSLNHALSLAQALHANCLLAVINRDYQDLLVISQTAADLCEKNNLGYFRFWARNFNALAEAGLSSPERLLSIRAHFPEMPEFSQTVAVWWFHCWVAEILLANGRVQEALAEVECAAGLVERSDERWGEAEIERIRGECLLAQQPSARAEAEQCLRQAMTTAATMGTLIFELRAAASLCKLLAECGRKEEGQAIVAAVLERFSEGNVLPELVAARALLV